MTLGAIGFATPGLLWALAALPVLWLILRAVPPAPVRRRFPGVALLLGLRDADSVSARTPWWLLLLRMLAVAALIVGLAGPVLNPEPANGPAAAQRPLLVVLDGSWASARDWPARRRAIEAALDRAARQGRPAAVMRLTAPERAVFRPAGDWRERLSSLAPRPWAPDAAAMARAATLLPEGRFETRWVSDGLARPGRTAFLQALESHGPVRVAEGGAPLLALSSPRLEEGALALRAHRLRRGPAREVRVDVRGTDPAGRPQVLARLPLAFAEGETTAEGTLRLPAELRARATRFAIAGQDHAGAVTLGDDALRRREVALIAGRTNREGLELLSPLHYLRSALAPTAEVIEAPLSGVLPANPDAIVLADVADLAGTEQTGLQEWVRAGGLLVRFAGPRLAASDVSRGEEAPLMPVRLRVGGRMVGGAMSWGEPKRLAPFAEGSPFYGLDIPDDVTVSAQVLAQPDPVLAERVIAQLGDGTPLVTRKKLGAGQVVLFHVSATAEWSTLPLSGLFVKMLERLAVSSGGARPEADDLAGTTWQPVEVLDAFGRLENAGTLPGVPGEALIESRIGPDLRAGLYESRERRLARNLLGADPSLGPAEWPARITVAGFARPVAVPLGGGFLAAALLLLLADIAASLALSGRLAAAGRRRGARLVAAAAGAVALLLAAGAPGPLRAQQGGQALPDPESEARAIAAAGEVVLGHVLTGDERVDDIARAGLRGLGRALRLRTSVEPDPPMGVDPERDELAFFPLLYWPVTANQPMPSAAAYAKLNEYLRRGGMIVFDTRDADIAGYGAASPAGARLQRLAAPLDVPALEPVPEDHVLTRTFYLLQAFPGRYSGREVWVEAAPPDAERAEGMPFRDLNDNVSPVVIGGNDWASAWAVDDNGNPRLPVGRGYAGERQREIAYRFGINLVMYVLTGNYKSDQVHVPALLERLGQ